MHTSLECSLTGEIHDPGKLQGLSRAGKPLLARYDLNSLKGKFTPDVVRARSERSMWRFHEVLPVETSDDPNDHSDPSDVRSEQDQGVLGDGTDVKRRDANFKRYISLGEGQTPLLKCTSRGPFGQFSDLLVKDESFNPTQSFKARGMSAAITRAAALGVTAVALPSAGNAAGAAAAYAARAGMKCVIFVPEDTPPANILESECGGAQVCLVNGLISDCGRLCRAACDRFGWFDLSTLKEPFRLEGKKTMGYELAFDMANYRATSSLQLPDVILYPTGGGTGLIGMWKAFDEMEQLGWIGPERPRMVVVQAEGCAPIVKAFRDGVTSAPMFPNAQTIAAGLRVPAAVGDFLMIDILRKSNGTALTVTDAELMHGVGELARHQGLHCAPEGGAIWMAAQKLKNSGWLRADETIVLVNTGAAVKYNHLLECKHALRLDHTDAKALDLLDQVGERRV